MFNWPLQNKCPKWAHQSWFFLKGRGAENHYHVLQICQQSDWILLLLLCISAPLILYCDWFDHGSRQAKHDLVYSDCLRRESNFLASTCPVTAFCARVCCIVCVWDCVKVIREPTHKLYSTRTRTRQLTDALRSWNYSLVEGNQTIDLIIMDYDITLWWLVWLQITVLSLFSLFSINKNVLMVMLCLIVNHSNPAVQTMLF